MGKTTTKEPMLDTRACRGDMTSREASSLLGALIEGLIAIFGAERTRRIVDYWATTDAGWQMKREMKYSSNPLENQDLVHRSIQEVNAQKFGRIDRQCEHIFGCALTGLCLELASVEDVRTAVRFWSERCDVVWETAEQFHMSYGVM